VQASRLVRSTPPGSTPAYRPDAGVHVKAAATGVATEGAAHGVLGLDGVASGGRVVDVPGGIAQQEERPSSDAEGGRKRSSGVEDVDNTWITCTYVQASEQQARLLTLAKGPTGSHGPQR
jgi:hypothetical protein